MRPLGLRFPGAPLRQRIPTVDKSAIQQRAKSAADGFALSPRPAHQETMAHYDDAVLLIPTRGLTDQQEQNSELGVSERGEQTIKKDVRNFGPRCQRWREIRFEAGHSRIL